MRSYTSILVAGLASSVLAAPHVHHNHARDEVVVVETAVTTDVSWVTITAVQDAPAPAATTEAPAAAQFTVTEITTVSAAAADGNVAGSGGHGWWRGQNKAVKFSGTEAVAVLSSSSTTFSVPAQSTTEQAPAPTTSQEAPAPPASSASSAPAGKATTYQQRVVDHHNVHRANHSSQAIGWSQSLADTAAKIAATCVYAHSMGVDGKSYGQNIAAGVDGNNVSAVITELFYNGEVGWYKDLYKQANPTTNFEKWGHFSQVVWNSTTQVGCATQYCPNGLANTGQYVSPYFTVCNYGPPGNYANEYADNVGDSLNQATVNWNYNL